MHRAVWQAVKRALAEGGAGTVSLVAVRGVRYNVECRVRSNGALSARSPGSAAGSRARGSTGRIAHGLRRPSGPRLERRSTRSGKVRPDRSGAGHRRIGGKACPCPLAPGRLLPWRPLSASRCPRPAGHSDILGLGECIAGHRRRRGPRPAQGERRGVGTVYLDTRCPGLRG